jgi:hypothetical protein
MQDFCKSVQKKMYDEDVMPKFETWEDVIAVVEKTRENLERKQNKGKFRQATKHLRSFCNGIKHHSTALKLLPTSNQYVSVLYGALATVIQVVHILHSILLQADILDIGVRKLYCNHGISTPSVSRD